MRELTLEELELVAGGSDTIVVVAPDGDGGGDWGGDWGGDYGGGDGGGGGGGGDSGGDPSAGQGETVPDIVVTGHQPPVTQLGDSGWTAQFYSDGVAVVRYMGGAPQEWNFTMDFGPNTMTATATIPPSVSATNTGMTYHFTGVHESTGEPRD